MTSAPLTRSAGPSLTRTLSNMFTTAPPMPYAHFSPLPPHSPYSSTRANSSTHRRTPGAHRPTAPELSARLSTARSRFEARQSSPALPSPAAPSGLSSNNNTITTTTHTSVFPRDRRRVAGLGFFLPLPPPASLTIDPHTSPAVDSAEASPGLHAFLYSPAYPLAVSAAAASPKPPNLAPRHSRRAPSPVAPDVIYSTPAPQPPTDQRYAALNPDPPYVRSPLAVHAWSIDSEADDVVAPSASASEGSSFPKTPGAPLMRMESKRGYREGDPEEAYYILPTWLLDSVPAGGDADYFSKAR